MEKLEKRIEKMERTLNVGDNFNEGAYLAGHNLIGDVQIFMKTGTFRPETPEVVKTATIEAYKEYSELPLCRDPKEFVISDLTLKEKCLALMLTVAPDHTFEMDRLDHEIQSYRSTLTGLELEEFEEESKRMREMTDGEIDAEIKRLREQCSI